jgi:hypothetical protein
MSVQTAVATGMHIGRSWSGTRIEDDCPCPKAGCGLVSSQSTDAGCSHHPFGAAKTIRQAHPAERCPGADG